MQARLFLAAVLWSLPCLPLVGCGSSTETTNEAGPGTMTADDVSKAEAAVEQAQDEERAQQSQNPVGKTAKSRR